MSPTPSSSFSSSSGNYPFHRSHQHHHHSQYQSQQQNQHRQHLGHPSSPNPSLPTAAPSVLQSPLPQPFVPRPRAIANLPEEFEPSSSTTTSSVRGGVRGARSFSSPSSSIQLGGDLRGQLSPNNNRSFAVGSDAYLTGTMAHDTHSYGWHNRPSHPHFQPSSMGYDQPFPTTQSLAPDSVPLGFAGHAQQGSRNYYPSGGLSSHYLSVPSGGLSQGSHHPRSVSMSYAYPGNTVGTLPMPDQSFLPSPSYFMHQSDYYLPETTLPSHPTSIPASSSASPQPQPPHHHHQHPQTRPLYYYSPHSQHQNQHHLPPPTSATTPPLTTPTPTASTPTDQTAQDRPVRVLSFRPKPQCWEHGCNGREFSTFSNLLRHQREKSGVVAKAECPVCGAVFTRTTARNIHLAQGKCKGRDGSG